MKTISIVIPTLNESEAIREVIEEIPEQELKEEGYDVEILVVDGGSTDGTIDQIRDLNVKNINEDDGKANAVRKGLDIAEGDYFFLIDGDSSYPAEKIADMVNLLEDGYSMVLGSRFTGTIEDGAMSLRNKIGNHILTWMGNKMYGTDVSDLCTGLRGIKIDELDENIPGEGFEIEAGIHIVMSEKEIGEIPIEYSKRKGKSKLHIRDGLRIGWRLLRG